MNSIAYCRGYSKVLHVVDGLCKSAGGLYGSLGPTELGGQSWWDRHVVSPFRRARRAFDESYGSLWHGYRAGMYDGAGDALRSAGALGSSMARVFGNTAADKFNSAVDRGVQAVRNRAGYIRAKHDYDSATIPDKPETYDKPSYEPGSTAGLVGATSFGGRVATDAAAAYAGVKGPLAALGNSTRAPAVILRGMGGGGNLGYGFDEAMKGNYGAAAAYTAAGVLGMAGPAGKGVVGTAQRVMNVPSKAVSAPAAAAMRQVSRAVPGATRAIAAGQTYVPAAMASLPDPRSVYAMKGGFIPAVQKAAPVVSRAGVAVRAGVDAGVDVGADLGSKDDR